MSGSFDLSDYEPVADRIAKFWADHPEGRIITDLLDAPEGKWTVQALVFRDGGDSVSATGLAHEVDGQGNVNRTSALENCETSAIGRALANLGYAAKGERPSREEMVKASRDELPPEGEHVQAMQAIRGHVTAMIVACGKDSGHAAYKNFWAALKSAGITDANKDHEFAKVPPDVLEGLAADLADLVRAQQETSGD